MSKTKIVSAVLLAGGVITGLVGGMTEEAMTALVAGVVIAATAVFKYIKK